MHTSDIPSTLNTSHTLHQSHTSHTSYTSHTSHTSITSHTYHTTHTAHTSLTSHTSNTANKDHPKVILWTPTTPVFAVATLPCFRDNELRALENHSEDASRFCPVYHGYKSQTLLPTYLTQFGRPQIRSACSCFDIGHYAAERTASTVSTEADFVSTSMAPSSSTIESNNSSSSSSSESSISTTSGSVLLVKTSNSASIPSPGRFAAILLLVLVIIPLLVPMMALLNDV